MDQSAATFRALSASVLRVHHTDVIKEDDEESGVMLMKRNGKGTQVLVDISRPDPKRVSFNDSRVEMYYPKINTVQEWDFSKQRALVDQFLLLGFGTPGRELPKNYVVRVMGEEMVAGQKTARIELLPKSARFKENFEKIELWIAEAGYPVRQKLFQPGGDYYLVTYSDLKWNPSLGDDALRLNAPKNAAREYPQK